MFPQRELSDRDYQIGTDVTAMLPLRRLGVPAPDVPVGSTAAVYYTRADGTRIGDGFTSVAWVYDIISRTALSRLMKFLGNSDWARVYIKTDIRDGNEALPRNAFGVYYGIMYRPILTGEEGSPIAGSMGAFQSVKIQFVDLVYQPGYL